MRLQIPNTNEMTPFQMFNIVLYAHVHAYVRATYDQRDMTEESTCEFNAILCVAQATCGNQAIVSSSSKGLDSSRETGH